MKIQTIVHTPFGVFKGDIAQPDEDLKKLESSFKLERLRLTEGLIIEEKDSIVIIPKNMLDNCVFEVKEIQEIPDVFPKNDF